VVVLARPDDRAGQRASRRLPCVAGRDASWRPGGPFGGRTVDKPVRCGPRLV